MEYSDAFDRSLSSFQYSVLIVSLFSDKLTGEIFWLVCRVLSWRIFCRKQLRVQIEHLVAEEIGIRKGILLKRILGKDLKHG